MGVRKLSAKVFFKSELAL